jgi:hypothetical protein
MTMHELILGFHCHQPVGNFPFVFREAYEKSYRPILETLEKAPKVRVSLHYSGPLFEWIEAEERGYFDRVRALVERGQVELWGSGFYEPILPSIPRADRIDQVKMMADRIEKRFGRRPRGLWLTERVWEPGLASDLAEAGVEYVAVDDHHFRLAGIDPDTIGGYYLTEDESRTLGVFPILKELRYRIPFAEPENVLEFVRERAQRGAQVPPTFYDDGEKFGVWPKTYESVWGKGWMKRFFDRLSDSDVKTVLPGEVRDRDRPQGRIYLPTASYPEMMEWALPAKTGVLFEELLDQVEHTDDERLKRARTFLAGGFWRNFLVKYPEINFLQKRVVAASKRLRLARADAPAPLGRSAIAQAEAHARSFDEPFADLFRAECNCAYWHGVFGGSYLPHLRRALWTHLIRAEKAVQASSAALSEGDLEADGVPVVRIETPTYTAHVKPGAGGALLGFDLLEPPFPLLDVVARRREAYHARMLPASKIPAGDAAGGIHGRWKALPEGVELVEDWHRRASVLDHVYSQVPRADDLAHARVRDEGDFAIEPFEREFPSSVGTVDVVLRRDGGVYTNGARRPLRLTRRLSFAPDRIALRVEWTLENTGRDRLDFWLATDWNLAFVPMLGHTFVYVRSPDGAETVHPDPESREAWKGPLPPQKPLTLDARSFAECGFRDRSLGVSVRIRDDSGRAQVLAYPITTVSQSEAGVDLVHQGTCLTVLVPVTLGPGGSTEWAGEFAVGKV